MSKFDTTTTPLFTSEMGIRLRYSRVYGCPKHWGEKPKRRRWGHKPECTCLKQTDLAARLGVSQYVISRIETGQLAVAPFTTGLFMSVMGKHADYILTGEGREKYEKFRYLGSSVKPLAPDEV